MHLSLPDFGRVGAERVSLPEPDAGLLARLSGLPHVALLDSASGGRYTLIAAQPRARLTWRPGKGELRVPGGGVATADDPFGLLQEALHATRTHADTPLEWGPGWIGLFGYGLRRALEEVPERHENETDIEDLDLSYYPAVAVHDAERAEWWLVWREACRDAAQHLLGRLMHPAPPLRGALPARDAIRSCVKREEYLAAAAQAVEYVRAGDVFQVNYSHEFRFPYEGDPLALYLALRRTNPAPYSAYLDLGQGRAVLSTSPELFLHVRGREVVTRPIKGTRPRGEDTEQDRGLRQELLNSEKDAAELAMIVDLERNDLGKVCEPGSVAVGRERFVESYASVHHLVAEVRGRIEEGLGRCALLEACFPGGSITGAPKVRAMQIIDELEAGRRGPYTGSIGWLGDNGALDLNIAIRTAVLGKGVVRVHVGGGIVADSQPEAEYAETLAKGEAMFRALSSPGV
ncbi:MAG: aminodeoxychorismate synthase component I [Planctomycetota bacterium]|nr:aminodeoxychorismate synthase component I [Planctomycetota bacterium]